MRLPLFPLALSAAACLLAGCSTVDQRSVNFAGDVITGTVHGGQQPVVGARLYLLAAGTAGYGTASSSLLNVGTSGSDAIGGYILTGPGGSFSISGDYLCASGQQVYLLALGGDPTGGSGTTVNNSAIGLMAALGNCPAAGTLALRLPHVSLNEATTVAAAYALAGFATDASHVSSSGTPQAMTGVANAFVTATNLVEVVNGHILFSTPVGGGVVPGAELASLSNIIAACINTPSASSNACTQLFSMTKSGGGSTGTAASDTASAMINIAHHPGLATAGLFGLIAGTSAPFQPSLTTAPNDFSVCIQWSFTPAAIAFDASGNLWGAGAGGGVVEFTNAGAPISPVAGYTGGGISATNSSNNLAIDPNNNVWVTSTPPYSMNGAGFNSYLSEFSNAGFPLSPSSGFTGGGLNQAASIAIDGTGNVWAGNYVGSTVSKFSSTGIAAPGSPFATGGQPYVSQIAIDNVGNVWTVGANTSQQSLPTSSLVELNGAGGIARTIFSSSSTEYTNLSLDASNNVWGTIYHYPYVAGSNTVFELNSSGVAINGSPFVGNTALDQCLQTQVDGAGNIWCASDDDAIAVISSTGVPISPDAGYISPNAQGPLSIAIDSSGNVWTAGDYSFVNNVFSTLTVEMVGGAAPVITPLALALKMGKTGTRP